MGCSIWESLVLGSLMWDSCFGILVFFDLRSSTEDPYFGIFASGSILDLGVLSFGMIIGLGSLVWDHWLVRKQFEICLEIPRRNPVDFLLNSNQKAIRNWSGSSQTEFICFPIEI